MQSQRRRYQSEYSGGCKGDWQTAMVRLRVVILIQGILSMEQTRQRHLCMGSGSQWAGDRYEGDYVNDKRNGKGIYVYTNGDR